MTCPQAALLFAAGFGTRMAPLTDTRPKPLIEVAGRSLLDHTLDICDGVTLRRRVVNTHYRHEQIAAHLDGRDILLSHEDGEILETGGGLRQAMTLLGRAPYYTLNTDAIWTGANPMQQLAAHWDPDVMDALLMCVPVVHAMGHKGDGDFSQTEDGRLIRGGGLIYGGIQIINPVGIETIAERAFSLNVLWNEIAQTGRLYGCVHSGKWCDVGQPESIPLAERLLSHV